jgi:hypothetical protein
MLRIDIEIHNIFLAFFKEYWQLIATINIVSLGTPDEPLIIHLLQGRNYDWDIVTNRYS